LLDDVQFLRGKPETQEAFFHVFNTLHELGRQIVLTSDRAPVRLDMLEERLRSRFVWGLTVDMSRPDYETRLAILQAKNNERGYGVSDEILELIASKVDSNIRELEGCLAVVSAHLRFPPKLLTLQEVEDLLYGCIGVVKSGKAPGLDEIIREVAEHFQVGVEELKGERRTSRITIPRQVAMYLCREFTHFSLKDIGEAFGGKDHTTVIYAVTKVEERLEIDEPFAKDIALLRAKLAERFGERRG